VNNRVDCAASYSTYSLLAFSGVSNSFHKSGLVSFAESVSLNKQKPSAVSYKTNILSYSEEGIWRECVSSRLSWMRLATEEDIGCQARAPKMTRFACLLLLCPCRHPRAPSCVVHHLLSSLSLLTFGHRSPQHRGIDAVLISWPTMAMEISKS